MTDIYGPGLWGDPPATPSADELEARRYDRDVSSVERFGALLDDGVHNSLFNWGANVLARPEALDFSLGLLFGTDTRGAPGRYFTPEEANDLYGIEGVLSFDRPVSRQYAEQRHESAQRDLYVADITARSRELFPLADFTAGLAAGFADPVNLGLWFMPEIGVAARLRSSLPGFAAAESGARGLGPQIAARGFAGAAEGAGQNALLEPLTYGLAELNDREYGLRDSLINVLVGAGIGGAAYQFRAPSAEALDDRARLPPEARRASPEMREAATLSAIGDLAEGRPVNVGEMFAAADAGDRIGEVGSVIGFETARGSRYEVDGVSTTRDKAARPEHPGEFGPQPPSDRTFYVTPDQARALATPDGDWRIVERNGALSLATPVAGDRTHWAASPSSRDIPFARAPREGLIPVELWSRESVPMALRDGGTAPLRGWRRVHFGNEIVAIERRPAPPAPQPEPAPIADAPTPPLPSREESAGAVAADIERQLKPRYSDQAPTIARVMANGFANLGAHYGWSAERAYNAVKLRIDDAAKAAPAESARRLGQDAAPPLSKAEQKAVRRADTAVTKAENQARAFLAAAECAALHGLGGNGMAEMIAGNLAGGVVGATGATIAVAGAEIEQGRAERQAAYDQQQRDQADQAARLLEQTARRIRREQIDAALAAGDPSLAPAPELEERDTDRYGHPRQNVPEAARGEILDLAAQMSGADRDYLATVIAHESQWDALNRPWDPVRKRFLSTAQGLGQFLDDTWKQMRGHFPAQAELAPEDWMALRQEPRFAAVAAGHFAVENARLLRDARGVQPTRADVYLAHFLGAGDALKIIDAAARGDRRPAAQILPEAAEANPGPFAGGVDAAGLRARQSLGFGAALFDMPEDE